MSKRAGDAGDDGKSEPRADEIIRPELNLEKWTIWQPARSKSKPSVRVLSRRITQPGGGVLTATVRVGFTEHGEPKTSDQLVYYALIKIFEEHGRPDASVPFSLRQIARILRKRWGTNVVASITTSLLRLRFTPFTWTNSYLDSATGTIKLLDTFNILSELRTSERDVDGSVNSAYGLFKFNDHIRRNLLANHTKPVFLDTVLNFKGEIAQMLYTQLELVMADKTHYERRTKELFEDLSLRGKAYKNLSDRKRLLKRALSELVGISLSTGVIRTATLEKCKEGEDFKAVFSKEPAGSEQHESLGASGEAGGDGVEGAVEVEVRVLDVEGEGPAQLVSFFYRTIHGVEKSEPSKRELAQASELIGKYGYERAAYVIRYGAREAPKTNYKPRVFGGIMQYADDAVREWDESSPKTSPVVRECDFCRPFAPGWRYVNPDNTARRCTHYPEVESKYENYGAPTALVPLAPADRETAELWGAAAEHLSAALGPDAVRTWLSPPNLSPLRVDGRVLYFRASNSIVRGWVEENFIEVIKSSLRQAGGEGDWEIRIEEAGQVELFS